MILSMNLQQIWRFSHIGQIYSFLQEKIDKKSRSVRNKLSNLICTYINSFSKNSQIMISQGRMGIFFNPLTSEYQFIPTKTFTQEKEVIFAKRCTAEVKMKSRRTN